MTRVVIPYSPHAKQREFHNARQRFRVLDWGRRTGKDRASVMETTRKMCLLLGENRPASLVPKVHAWAVAPSFPLARQMWNELLAYTPKQIIRRVDRSELYIEYVGGGLLELKSADKPDSLVGVGLDILWITEAARIQREAWEENLRPTLSSPNRGPGMAGKGEAVINSTPKGRNWFWELYGRGFAFLDSTGNLTNEDTGIPNPTYDPEYWSSHATSLDNPHFQPDEWVAAQTQLPENVFRQEYCAEFLADSAGVFQNVDACATGLFLEPVYGRSYVVGVDLARLVDFTVITVMDKETKQVVAWKRFNQIRWEMQRQEIIRMAKHYNNAAILIDATAIGDPIVEALQDELGAYYPLEGYKFTADSKERAIQSLQLALQELAVSYPNIPELLTELKAYEYEFTRTGRFRYNAAPGYHDDCVISLALALLGTQIVEHKTTQFTMF